MSQSFYLQFVTDQEQANKEKVSIYQGLYTVSCDIWNKVKVKRWSESNGVEIFPGLLKISKK